MTDTPHACPECKKGIGLTRGVSTIKGRTDVVLVTRVCQSCGYTWDTEQVSPSMGIHADPPRKHLR